MGAQSSKTRKAGQRSAAAPTVYRIPEAAAVFAFDEKKLSPLLAQAAKPDFKVASKLVRRECPGTVSLELFSADFTKSLLQFIGKIAPAGSALETELNSLQGVRLERIPEFCEFMRRVAACLERLLRWKPNFHLNFEGAFALRYTQDANGHFVHQDNIDLTLNLNLGETFKGGQLLLAGRDWADKGDYKCERVNGNLSLAREALELSPNQSTTQVEQMNYYVYNHEPGRAIVHPGRQLHLSVPVKSGVRVNVVVWLSTHSEFKDYVKLPPNLQTHVLSFISRGDMVRLRRAGKSLGKLTYHEPFWHKQLELVKPPPPSTPAAAAAGADSSQASTSSKDDDDVLVDVADRKSPMTAHVVDEWGQKVPVDLNAALSDEEKRIIGDVWPKVPKQHKATKQALSTSERELMHKTLHDRRLLKLRRRQMIQPRWMYMKMLPENYEEMQREHDREMKKPITDDDDDGHAPDGQALFMAVDPHRVDTVSKPDCFIQ